MRRVSGLLLVWLLFAVAAYGAGTSDHIAYSKRWIRGIPVHVVTADLNVLDVRVSTAIARNGIGTAEGFGSMLSRLQPTAAITGTYFCMKSLVPVGDIVIDGRLVNIGTVGTGVCFKADNTVEFRSARGAGAMDWADCESVVCAGPRLVTNGAAYVAPWAEGFRDRSHYRKARRSALGITRHNKLLLLAVTRPVYLSKLAKIMRDLGAVDAVSLDGGSSTALYYRGRVLSHPGRRLTNLIVVYESADKFARVKPALAPSPLAARTSQKS